MKSYILKESYRNSKGIQDSKGILKHSKGFDRIRQDSDGFSRNLKDSKGSDEDFRGF